MKRLSVIGAMLVVLAGCGGPPSGVPQIVQNQAAKYLSAWQRSDWETVYRYEQRKLGDRPILHDALTDSLVFYTINEVRYSDSAAACAVTLHWEIIGRPVTEAGEIYFTRTGKDWRVSGFKGF